MVDAHGIMVKNAMLINGDYVYTQAFKASSSIYLKKLRYGLFANRKTYFMALSQQIFSNNIVINIRSKNLSFPT